MKASRQHIIAGAVLLLTLVLSLLPLQPSQQRVQSYDNPNSWSEWRNLLSEQSEYEHDRRRSESSLLQRTDGKIYQLLERNVSTVVKRTAKQKGSMPVRIKTNRFGLRGDDFTKMKPPNTTRILVVGDSYTYGAGVNNSDRYTDILERWLNERYDRRIQVINAGIGGFGMKDYYVLLKQLGLSFNPDIVVVQILNNDWVSKNQSHVIRSKTSRLLQDHIQNGYSYAEAITKAREMTREWILKQLEGKTISETDFSYMYNISRLVGQDTPLLFYSVDALRPATREFVQQFDKKKEHIPVVFGPHEFRNDRQQYERPGNSELRVSRFDNHPNAKGHRLLAEKLYPVLNRIYTEQNSQPGK